MTEHMATSHKTHYVNKYSSHVYGLPVIYMMGLGCFVFFALHLSH